MGTIVSIQVVSGSCDAEGAIGDAFAWFHEIEARCTRFDEQSELMQLCARVGEAVPASAILFEAVQFAMAVAEETDGAFDPTVGHRIAARGFDREHRTGRILASAVPVSERPTWRDVHLDPDRRTIMLRCPMILDLGAVAKGLAVDAAARELASFRDFAIDAGGDLYLGGLNPLGEPWTVGIRHPRRHGELIDTLRVSNQAVCTSGDYERGPHILDPRTEGTAQSVASATVVAGGAMLADALATAAFVLGPRDGIELLTRMGVDGLIVTPGMERYETRGVRGAA